MRRRSAAAAVLLATLALAGCAVGGTTKTVTVTVERAQQQPSGPLAATQNARYFGEIVSLQRADSRRYLLVLRPEFFLVGVAANVAFAAQQGTPCAPLSCPGVPDDRLVLPAGATKLTFVLPATTRGTVLTSAKGTMHATAVSGAQLAALVAGAKTPHLLEPLVSGVWLSVDVDKVTSFSQQFQP